ncbi:MAG: redox-regulated ATPase YchF [Candidatus Omnitrophica bacterium]|nr:redox-regulated ATPase YchF [Candidatus Omnitrophota bacterium]
MGFKAGIVGLPNVGKSTLFNALTQAGTAAVANYPFCTIDPNKGAVPVPDERLQKLAEIYNSEKIVPTQLEFMDIAGLVKGASQGQGLGNQFLSHIGETDAILHIVRCFEDPDVVHVEGKIDPVGDIEIINTELAIKDLEVVASWLNKMSGSARSGNKEAKIIVSVGEKLKKALAEGKWAKSVPIEPDEMPFVKAMNLLTVKPVLYVANVSENDVPKGNAYVEKVSIYAKSQGSDTTMISAKIESEIAQLSAGEQKEFLNSLGLKETALNQMVRAGYKLLKLISFFAAGPKEVHAWTAAEGTTAPDAAGQIHTDFREKFIRMEVVSADDLIKYRTINTCKEKGLLRTEGRDYAVRDGDVVHIKI